MSDTLLQTKLFMPRLRHTVVTRPRVTAKLNAGLRGKLTLVSAPAGFGKSTALSTWAGDLSQPVAWLSLDERDNDPVRFWTYMSAALQTLVPSINDTVSLDAVVNPLATRPLEATVIGLVNNIAAAPDPRLQLIVDDYHVIATPQVNETLHFFLDNLPDRLHVTLAGRTDPPWPLARLRARGELTEVRTPDLRFTTEETATFLRDVMGLDLTPAEIATLEERTEGWIAGLQMAALSMRDRDDLAGFINALSGSHRFIMDYLLEEVLNKQPADIRDFLLQTSILRSLTPDLCNAVTGRDDSARVLAELEQANLFLEPQDDTRRWYRYHRLFADLLVDRQQRTQPAQKQELHRRAGAWYEAGGQLGEAMNHAYAAGDVERQIQLLADNVLTMAYQGELTTLVQWLERLPAITGRQQPWYHLSRAWVLVFAGHLDKVEAHVIKAEQALAATPDEFAATEREYILGQIAALRGYVLGLQGDWPRSYDYTSAALAHMPDTNLVARGWTTLLLAVILRAFGRLDQADQAFMEADALSRAAGFTPLTVDVLWERSEMQRTQGKLRGALDSCRDVLELAADYRRQTGRRLAPTGYTYTGIAAVLREWNELDAALENAHEAVTLSKRWGMADAIIRSHIQLAWTLQAAGSPDAAQAAMDEAGQIARAMSPMYQTYVGGAAAKLHLLQGKLDAVAAWADAAGIAVDDALEDGPTGHHVHLAYLLVKQQARGRLPSVQPLLRLLTRLEQRTTATGAHGELITVLALRALALAGDGREDAALEPLARALEMAAPERFTRTFVDMGPPMRTLLLHALSRGIAGDYVRRLLAACDDPVAPDVLAAAVDPLTERELEILRLLPTSLSTVDMAAQLVVAPSTVRTHIKSIYSKLQVNRRTDAVKRAGELKLI